MGNHSNDKRLAPQSQSAKKLKNKSPFQRYANDKMRSMHMSPNKLLSPPPPITILPNLQSSQESEAYSPRLPNKKRAILQQSDCISIPVQNTNYYQFDAAKTKIFKQKKFWIQLFEETDVWKSLLFAIFGFFIGFIVCSSAKATDKIINGHIVDICTCDIAQNKSTALCNPCIDQYWSLESKYNECNAENVQIKRQCDEILNGQRQSNDIFMINELERCQSKRKRFNALYEKCMDENVNYQNEIKQFALGNNELGECNVEWAACEQLGHQKDKLNERRLEEIEKQRNKFKNCNDALKKMKQRIKENK